MSSRPQYVVEAVESETTWILTARTPAGLVVHEVDKSVSFIAMFDEVQTAIAACTAVPITHFDVRFSLSGQQDRDSAQTRDESGT